MSTFSWDLFTIKSYEKFRKRVKSPVTSVATVDRNATLLDENLSVFSQSTTGLRQVEEEIIFHQLAAPDTPANTQPDVSEASVNSHQSDSKISTVV